MGLPGKSLIRLRQVLAKIEAVKGVAESLTGAENIPRIINPKWSTEPLQVAREVVRGTLTKLPKLVPGQTKVTMTFDVEVGGLPGNLAAPSVFVEPAWGPLLSGCGFKKPVGTLKLTIPSVTGGPFRHGEVVNQAVSSAVGVVIRDTYTADDFIFIQETSGTFDATNTITGDDSAATTTPSVLNSTTFGDHQVTSDIATMSTLTMRMETDGKHILMRGAMGNVQLVFQHGRPLMYRFEFQGIKVSETQVANTATALFTTQNTPPTFHSSDMNFTITDGSLTVSDGDLNFTLSELTVNMNNEVQMRDNSVAGSDGLNFACVTDKNPAGSFNPDQIDEAVYDWIGQLESGTINRLDVTMGQTLGNQFVIPMRGLQFQNAGDLDLDSVQALDMSFDLTGGDYGSGVHGNNNEIMILDL